MVKKETQENREKTKNIDTEFHINSVQSLCIASSKLSLNQL